MLVHGTLHILCLVSVHQFTRLGWTGCGRLDCDSVQPLSCLGNSEVKGLPSKQYFMGSSPTRATPFAFTAEKDAEISCVALL